VTAYWATKRHRSNLDPHRDGGPCRNVSTIA
jgi:hypothetical protein